MFSRIFPRQFDNNYRGSRLAIWLFVPILFLRFMMGFNSVFFTRSVAISADGLNLTGYPAEGINNVLSLYALLGLSLMMFSLIGAVALIRYRTMLPFLYLLLLIQQAAGKVLNALHPSSGSPNTIALVFVFSVLALTIVGFVLSLRISRPSLAEGAR